MILSPLSSRTSRALAALMLFAGALLLGGDSPRTTSAQGAGLTVRTVPWLGLPSRPHEVYSGGTLILQGVATLGLTDTPATGLASAVWSFDDGSPNIPSSVSNPLAIEATKVFTGPDGPITATLTVTTLVGEIVSDTFKIAVVPKTLDVEANMAIDKGLWYLHKQITRFSDGTTVPATPVGYITGPGSTIAATSGSVQALQINNHLTTGNPAEDPYVHDVSRMLRWLESRLQVQTLTLQNGNNPDTDGNNKGLFASDNSVNYIVGQVMDAFVSSATPTQTAVLGPAGDVRGRTYAAIVQDMMDFNNWSQMDVNAGQRGSWYYTSSNNTSTGHADNSIAQWPAIGGIAGERVWGLTTPQWVKNEVLGMLPFTYNTAANGSYSGVSRAGSFGYANANQGWSENVATTPSALVQYIWASTSNDTTPDTADEQRFRDGLGFMARYHRIKNSYQCCDTTHGGINFYALYATTKAYRLALNESGVPEPVTLVDDDPADAVPAWNWYSNDPPAGAPASAGPKGVARAVIGNQAASGQFPGAGSWTGNLSTAWGVIILSPSLFELGPTAVCTANPNQVGSFGGSVNFNGTGSFHNNQDGTIVSYDWDFGDSTSGTGSTALHTYAGGAPATFSATLTVTDAVGLTDTTSCTVTRVNTNVAPDANPGGPYSYCPGSPLILNGSGSADEEDDASSTPLTYAWDLEAPFNYTPADSTAESFDATAFFSARPPGDYNIVLRVTDSLGVINAEFTTVTVRAANDPVCNQPPDAVDDSATTFSGTPVTVPVLGNDTDPDVPANTLTVTATTPAANGSVTIDAATTVTYTPVLGFYGIDTFTYSISDGKGGTDTATVTITVNRRLATVTAGSGTKVYGEADPSIPPSSTGFLPADGITLDQTRAPGNDVGNYATTATAAGAALGNYDVTYTGGNLEITPAPVTATAGSGTTVYDGATHAPSACVVTGAYTGDLACSNDPATFGPGVSTTTIAPSVTGTGLSNYAITPVNGLGSITIAPSVTVVTCTPSVVYTGAAFTVCSANVTGVGGLNEAVTVTYTDNVNVGTASASATYGGDTNHTASTGTATFEITKASATVTAGSGTKVYGTPDPAMPPSSSGFFEAMTLSQTRAPGEDVGNYATNATAAGATLGNYDVTYIAGNLAITKAPTTTTLTSSPSPQAAGQTVTLTATVTAVAPTVGIPNGTVTFMDGATTLGTATVDGSGVAVFTTTALAVGPHSISASYSGSSNYFPSAANAVSQLIYGYPTGGGTFVIGNNNAVLGNNVNFWGAQWEKNNSMTGGSSNASFKGFAVAPNPPTVGAIFTSAPGNSAPPPSAVPEYIGIIVTSKVTKSGSNITGTIVQLVVVKVNPGYQGNPGNAGTGTIVAILP